jgi:hypothetical protein
LSTNNIDPHWTVYWISRVGSSLAQQGVLGQGYYSSIPPESFRIYGPATVTPEPAGMTLLGIGLASLAGYGWRRRKQSALRTSRSPRSSMR